MGTNESTVVFRSPLSFQVHVSARAISAIVMVTHRCATIVAQEVVLLVVSAAEEFESTWVRVVAHGLQDHVVALLDSTVADILHGLDKGQCASVGALGFVLEVHGEGRLMVDIVTSPQVH